MQILAEMDPWADCANAFREAESAAKQYERFSFSLDCDALILLAEAGSHIFKALQQPEEQQPAELAIAKEYSEKAEQEALWATIVALFSKVADATTLANKCKHEHKEKFIVDFCKTYETYKDSLHNLRKLILRHAQNPDMVLPSVQDCKQHLLRLRDFVMFYEPARSDIVNFLSARRRMRITTILINILALALPIVISKLIINCCTHG